MTDNIYHDGNRQLQDRFDTRRLADRLDEKIVKDVIDEHDALMSHYPEAQFIVRVRAREVFPNCPRYIHHYTLVERSKFVPKSECKTPIPDWKQGDWVADVLPENDPTRAVSE